MLLLQRQRTPLHFSCEHGHVDIVKALLSHGAAIHVKDDVSKHTMYYNECIDYNYI